MRVLLPAQTGLIWNWKQNPSCSNWRGELSLHRSPLQSGSARVSSHGFSIGSHTLTNTNCEGEARQYDAGVLNHLISENLCRRCHECDWKVGPSCLNMCSWTSDGVFCVTWWIFAGKRVRGALCAARWRELTIVQLQKVPTLKWKSSAYYLSSTSFKCIFWIQLDIEWHTMQFFRLLVQTFSKKWEKTTWFYSKNNKNKHNNQALVDLIHDESDIVLKSSHQRSLWIIKRFLVFPPNRRNICATKWNPGHAQ